MAKPFRIDVDSIAEDALSVPATAAKYGVPEHELKRVRAFVRRDASQRLAKKSAGRSAKTGTAAANRKSR
jgi:hypothetical protein